MARMTGAQAAIAALRLHGVETIFGIPGIHTLPLYDALLSEGERSGTPGIRHVLARHEQGAGYMAGGYARVTGRPGVVCTITGPGVTNVATPMADAHADSLPLLVLSTSLPRASIGRPRGELHELKDQLGVMEALAGWTRAVGSVEEIPDAVRDAFHALRSRRPRGAYLQIPLDLLEQEADFTLSSPAPITPAQPDPKAIAAAAELLRQARSPLIIAGAGVTAAGANDLLARLAELLQAPVLLGGKSRDVLPTAFPLVVPATSYNVPKELSALLAGSDVALVVGSKLGAERTAHGTLPLPAKMVHIDSDAVEIGRQYRAKIGIVADAKAALEALIAALADLPPDRPSRAGETRAVRAGLMDVTRRTYGSSLAYLDALRAALPHSGVVAADMTMLSYACGDYLHLYEPRSFLFASELCAIGCGLPMAIGARVGAPTRPVVALCGDGGFLLNMGELATAVQERIDLTVIVFNDATYTAVKSEQKNRFARRYIATDLRAPDYVALAKAFGAEGVLATSPEALQTALAAAVARPGVTLIEVPLPQREW